MTINFGNAAMPKMEKPIIQKWLLVAPDEGDECCYGSPYLIREEELEEEQRKASQSTGGNWGIRVLAEVQTSM